jgi:hypothetical protein
MLKGKCWTIGIIETRGEVAVVNAETLVLLECVDLELQQITLWKVSAKFVMKSEDVVHSLLKDRGSKPTQLNRLSKVWLLTMFNRSRNITYNCISHDIGDLLTDS